MHTGEKSGETKPRHIDKWAVTLSLTAVCLLALTMWAWQVTNSRTDQEPNFITNASHAADFGATKSAGATNTETTTLIAVGDIMVSRYVEEKMIHTRDWRYPFLQTAAITSRGEIIFGNLESPLVSGPIVETDGMSFRADPRAVSGLSYAGFNVLSLANNHMKNKGGAGITSTITTLDQANILHAGAGLDDVSAREPAIIEKNRITFGFLAYTDSAFTPAPYEATPTRSGSPFLNEKTLADDITKLKLRADVVIVSMHAGTEYQDVQNQKQINFAHQAIDLGAQVVIGHHPHVVQPVEYYRDGYILYSLGNFVFDQMWSEKTQEGAIATITFSGIQPISLKITPIKIFEYAQPRVIEGTEADAILMRMDSFTK
jgi:poly-gamma-glutamate synthesis protein (capsule biosynthesis protein)